MPRNGNHLKKLVVDYVDDEMRPEIRGMASHLMDYIFESVISIIGYRNIDGMPNLESIEVQEGGQKRLSYGRRDIDEQLFLLRMGEES